ncbi:MAG TPA: hypothetical protein VK797_17400, partial [Tepidisphaeraceae bacterium]|nr:hypothetical protein [Tepidisphaeraceae bacterium]
RLRAALPVGTNRASRPSCLTDLPHAKAKAVPWVEPSCKTVDELEIDLKTAVSANNDKRG